MIRYAFAAIQRNYQAFFIYIAIHVSVSTIVNLVSTQVIQPLNGEIPGSRLQLLFLAASIVDALAWALAQSIGFARIGRELDRPFWKVDSDREAVKRFFPFWLLVDLGLVFIVRLLFFTSDRPDYEQIVPLSQLLLIFYTVSLVPVGAAVMFQGHVRAREFEHGLQALFRHLPQTLGIMFIQFLSFFILITFAANPDLPVYVRPVVDIVDSYVDCFLFACTWYICIRHRDEEEEDPFDL